MTSEEMIEWIDNACYEALLSKWRFEPAGSPWFSGEIGEHFADAMSRSRSKTPHDKQVSASKSLGWSR